MGCGKKKEAERQAEAPEIPDGGISAITTPEAQRENSAPLKVDIKKPLTGEESAKVIEAVIRDQLEKPIGELTKADLQKVVERDLRYNQLTNVKGLEQLTNLTYLNLSDNHLSNVKGLEKLTSLDSLILLVNPKLTNVKIKELQQELPECRVFHSAQLTYEESLEKIEADVRKYIKTQGSSFTKDDYSKITKVGEYREIRLPFSPQIDLRVLGVFPNLKELNLRYAYYGRDVDSLPELKGLVYLSLMGCLVTNVSNFIKLKRLERLNLNNNRRLKDIKCLAELKQLKNLWLIDTEIPASQLDYLKKKLPKCRIIGPDAEEYFRRQ